MSDVPALEMQGVSRSYAALRPLRIDSLRIAQGERVSIGGLEAGASELLVNLVTGASLPDTGEIRVLGRLTSDIADGDAWLESLDRFGIVSPRGVLLEGSSLLQNLAMPFTLDIEPVPDAIAAQVDALARTCGIDPERWLHAAAGTLPPDVRVRAHMARSLALNPQLVIVEHPTADVERGHHAALAADLAGAFDSSPATVLLLTNDDALAAAVTAKNLKLDPATGKLRVARRGWFSW